MKTFYKLLGVVLLLVNNILLFAQKNGGPGSGGYGPGSNEDPPNPGGAVGGHGPGGKPTSPIDMYEIILVIAAIFLIYYFYQKSKKLKIS